MSSAVKVARECTDTYDDMKTKKMWAYIIYILNDNNTEIVIREKGEKGTSYDDFKAKLVAKDAKGKEQCCYASYDLYFTYKGKARDKMMYFLWTPLGGSIKDKMMTTSANKYLNEALGAEIEMQVVEESELAIEKVEAKAAQSLLD